MAGLVLKVCQIGHLQYAPPKHWYLPTRPHGVTSQKVTSTSSPAWEPQICYRIFADIFTYRYIYDTRILLNRGIVHGIVSVKMITNPSETNGMQELWSMLRSTCIMTLSSLIPHYFHVVTWSHKVISGFEAQTIRKIRNDTFHYRLKARCCLTTRFWEGITTLTAGDVDGEFRKRNKNLLIRTTP
jgi:hypothetical protein